MPQPDLNPRDPSETPATPAPFAFHPPSILWAHQLRRDIVVLTELIKELQGDHATTTKILTDLGETVDLLLARIRTLELQHDTDKLILARHDTKLEELANSHTEQLAKYKNMLDGIRATLEKTESVNQTLQGRVEILEQSSWVRQENTTSEQAASAGENRLHVAVFVNLL
jgi:chromosome segregation ATPase